MEKELVEYIAKALVDNPSGVNVNVIEGEKSTILELKVSDGDIGKVIGKHGRIAKAIRTILSAAATKKEKRVVLEILD
ncbi:MAG: KH domain-containing protein [Spirochaetia bacterium]